MARLPPTQKVVRERVHRRYNQEEAVTLGWAAELGSETSRISKRVRLTRDTVTAELDALKDERPARATFASFVCASRFKFFAAEVPGSLIPTRRPVPDCFSRHSFEHMQECLRTITLSRNPEFVSDYFIELAHRANIANPGFRTQLIED